MEGRRRLFGLIASIAGLWAMQATSPALAQEKARPAEEFMEMVGFNGSLSRTADLGGRHNRGNLNAPGRLQGSIDWYNSHGIQSSMLIGSYTGWNVGSILTYLKQYPAGVVDLIEGPNEIDYTGANGNITYKGTVNAEAGYLLMKDLYPALKADPALRRIPVIAPSWVNASFMSTLGPLNSFDFQAMHPYPGPDLPSYSLFGYGGRPSNISISNQMVGSGNPTRPIVPTETGYNTNLSSDQRRVSYKAQAKYIPRQFLEYFNAGIPRMYLFKIEEEDHYGLIDKNGVLKPSYAAVKNLLTRLNDSTWDPVAKRRNAPIFDPGWLDYTLIGGGGVGTKGNQIRHTLLQKGNGDFYLMLWQEVYVYDRATSTDITNADVPATLLLRTPITGATVYRYNDDGTQTTTAATVGGAAGSQTIALSIPDTVLFVKLTPSGGLAATQNRGPAFLQQKAAVNSGGAAASPYTADAGVFTYTHPSPYVCPAGPVRARSPSRPRAS
jgi:hypothetical protein